MLARPTISKQQMSGSPQPPPDHLSLGLPGMLAHKQFPGRASLMVPEVAKVLGIDEKSVIRLILDGLLGAVEITGRGNKTSREHWRIPVECFDDYIRRRSNTTEGKRE